MAPNASKRNSTVQDTPNSGARPRKEARISAREKNRSTRQTAARFQSANNLNSSSSLGKNKNRNASNTFKATAVNVSAGRQISSQSPDTGSIESRSADIERNVSALPHNLPSSSASTGQNGSEDEETLSLRLVNGTRDAPSPLITERGVENDDGNEVGNTPGSDQQDSAIPPLEMRRNRRLRSKQVAPNSTEGGSRMLPVFNSRRERNDGNNDGEHHETLAPSFNLIKTQLLEVQRDKRIYASTVICQTDKIESLKRELQHKNLQILSLEESLNKKSTKSTGKEKIWSQDNLGRDGIAEYQGICLAVGRLGSTESGYLVTESFIDPNLDNTRRRDWTTSANAVSMEKAKAAVQFVTLPDGTTAVPTSVMARALELRFYSSPYKKPSGFLKHCLKKVLCSPAASFMNDDEKKLCEAKVASHRPTTQKFRAILSDCVGNRKKIARNTYLRSLGYYNAVRPSSRKDTNTIKEMRDNEKGLVSLRCVNTLESGKVSTNFWRTSDWKVLCYQTSDVSVASEMEQGEHRLEENNEVDCWFLNEAARRSFLELRGYPGSGTSDEFANDDSIITLARCDAAMTTMLKMITVAGRGGVRNNGFIESFRTLLPLALELIIKELWMDISHKAEHELCPFIGNSSENEDDPFGNNLRDYTIVQINPDDNYIYLVASAKYIRENVCSWYGNIKDAHLGRCKQSENEFVMIHKHMKFDEDEMSDVDVLSCEEIPSPDIDGGESPNRNESREE